MTTTDVNITFLHRLDALVTNYRKQCGLHTPGEVVWSADSDVDRKILVTADGYGQFVVEEVQGNYPCDYLRMHASEEFTDEYAACELALGWLDGTIDKPGH